MPAPVPALLVFTDATSAATRARGVVETVARALAEPCPDVAVVVRAKDRSIAEVRALCAAMLPIARAAGAQLFVHTHVGLVAELGLDGAHLSSNHDVVTARALLPAGAVLGASRHAQDAVEGLDYATLSPVFPPHSKPNDARTTLGLGGLRDGCARSGVPVLALGGISPDNARACLEAGARGVAVLGFVMAAHDPQRALAALRRSLGAAPTRE